jgi:hypothetical protein
MVLYCQNVIIDLEVASLVRPTADPAGCHFYAHHNLFVSTAFPALVSLASDPSPR